MLTSSIYSRTQVVTDILPMEEISILYRLDDRLSINNIELETLNVYCLSYQYNFQIMQTQKPDTKTLHLPTSHIRQINFADRGTLGILVTVDSILVVDIVVAQVVKTIRKSAYPRSAKISKCGKFIVAHYNDNIVYIINAITGKDLQTVMGIPQNTRNFYFSDDSRKLIFGNNQIVCIWSISDCSIEIMSQNWKNINCFAIHSSGNQFCLGTYSGTIYVLTILQGSQGSRCKQIEFNRHQSCIMCIAYQNDKIISISHDKRLFITTMYPIHNSKTNQTEIQLSYEQRIISWVPKEIISTREKFFLKGDMGIMWFDSLKQNLMCYDDRKVYSAIHSEDDEVIIFKLDSGGLISWWPAIKFIREKTLIQRTELQVKRVFRYVKKQTQEGTTE